MSDRICTVSYDESSNMLIYGIDTTSSKVRGALLPKSFQSLLEVIEQSNPFCGLISIYRPLDSDCKVAIWREMGDSPEKYCYALNTHIYRNKIDFLKALLKNRQAAPFLLYFLKKLEI